MLHHRKYDLRNQRSIHESAQSRARAYVNDAAVDKVEAPGGLHKTGAVNFTARAVAVARRYSWRARKWAKYASGKSLHNVPQGIGKAYVPTEVEGYFNDLTGKTKWQGDCDHAGIPIVCTDRGNRFNFPITVFQKGLGHWDSWLISRRSDMHQRDHFMRIADWAVRTIDHNSGWECWRLLNRGTTSPYSSMAQGQGASVLARAFATTGDVAYRDVASIAVGAMINPDSVQRVARRDSDGLWLEEYPGSAMPAVLNGWIFSLMGLHDLSLVDAHAEFQAALRETLTALERALPRYDCGYWSSYDLGGTICSPFYHRLHIAQLRVLAQTFHDQTAIFDQVAERWTLLDRKPSARARALMVKVAQKLNDRGNEEFS